jgi:hypothetical protein
MSCSDVNTDVQLSDNWDLICQHENFCLVYSILNVLPSHEQRCKFLCVDPNKYSPLLQDKSCFEPLTEFLLSLEVHANSTEKFQNGITTYDMEDWIEELVRRGVVAEWNVEYRKYKMSSFVFRNEKSTYRPGDKFLILGYGTNKTIAESISAGIKRSITDDCVEENIKKAKGDNQKCYKIIRELTSEQQNTYFQLLKYSKQKPVTKEFNAQRAKYPNAKFRKWKTYSQHAIGLVFDNNNIPVLYDPGKRKYRRLMPDDPKLLDKITTCLTEHFAIYKLHIVFN